MSDHGLSVEPATEVDAGLSAVRALLEDSGLPAADLRDDPGSFFIAVADGERVAAGGLELYGSAGLLRSLVVAPGQRGQGYGTALCSALELRAWDAGVTDLSLLTTTARPFFARRGYEVIDRADAPASIRDTEPFASLCPDSATCMTRSL